MPAPQCYVALVGGVVVRRHAVGARPDGTYPSVPSTWVPVTLETYLAVREGDVEVSPGVFGPDGEEAETGPSIREWILRLRGRLKAVIAGGQALQARVDTLEAQVAQGAAVLQQTRQRVVSLEARVTALEQGS